jgi:cell division protein YceG involved in septum cleavage
LEINKLVIKQLNNFEEKVYNKILSDKNPNEIYEIVNLGSIVEKEEKSDKEKPTVAGILKKRFENNWNI